jgi:hypothetical protein
MQELHGITEIRLKRLPCYGKCPVYEVIIQADGRFRYVGEQFVERLGEHTGQVNLWSLNKLAQLIKDVGFMDLRPRYAVQATCKATVLTTVVMDSVKKKVSNYGGGGPAELWAIQELIDQLLLNAKWDEGSG